MVSDTGKHIGINRMLRIGVVEHGETFGPGLGHDALLYFVKEGDGHRGVWIVTMLYAGPKNSLIREAKACKVSHAMALVHY